MEVWKEGVTSFTSARSPDRSIDKANVWLTSRKGPEPATAASPTAPSGSRLA
jgi:hypothetical protein